MYNFARAAASYTVSSLNYLQIFNVNLGPPSLFPLSENAVKQISYSRIRGEAFSKYPGNTVGQELMHWTGC